MAVAYQRREQTFFSTVKSEGAILPMDLLQRVSDPQSAQLAGLAPDDYHLVTDQINEAIHQAWTGLRGAWLRFQSEKRRLSAHESGTTLTRERWLLPLLKKLDYGQLQFANALVIGEQRYPISHRWQNTPIHLVSYKLSLDQRPPRESGTVGKSPHSLLQELLNRSADHLWGIVSNGHSLRILRDNRSLTRPAYVEFNLEEMFNNEAYADFSLFWLLCHQSRFEVRERPEECWLEKWSREAHQTGLRARDTLRDNVEQAIKELGSGYLSHPANARLRARLRTKKLSALGYYKQLLRMVYRLLILFVAEDRDILFHPAASAEAREHYRQYYSTAKLRAQADRQLGTRHSDLYCGLKLVMDLLGREGGYLDLGLPALNGHLFSAEFVSDLNDCQLANYALLAAVRHLAYTESGRTRRIIDYKNLGSEELGSVYESLLELHPVFHLDTGTFELASAGGNQRKTTGSYYTPTSLITCLLDSVLDPVLNEALDQPTAAEAEAAILKLKICDPACGSGHFLVAAAHRVAKKLAAVRTGDEEPALSEHRTALRDVVSHCIYGVDSNEMAVELCKVSLWIESIEPGKPLSFLDAHIQCGNSLLGATPALLKQGIPDAAFEPLEGDDRTLCSKVKKLNKQFREGNQTLRNGEARIFGYHSILRESIARLDAIDNRDVQGVYQQQQAYDRHRQTVEYRHSKLWADAWCAAFVWKKRPDALYPFTQDDFRALGQDSESIDESQRNEIERLAEQYQFFHWHLAFPDVFRVPDKDEEAENATTGWSGGFDVVLGNPPWERIKIQEKEWFATCRPDIANAANAAQRKRMIEQLQREDPKLYNKFHEDLRKAEGESALVRRSGFYPLSGRGDVNTYSLFTENMRTIIASHRRVGCIVPSGIATDDTTRFFFQDLMGKQSLLSLHSFENREKLFAAVDSRYSFSLLSLTGPERPATQGTDFAFFALQAENLRDRQRHFTLSAQDIELINPNTKTSPIFRSTRDAELNLAIYKKVPVLINEQTGVNPWSAYYMRLVDLGDHTAHLRFSWETRREDWNVPLYEAKLFRAFDHRFSTFENVSRERCIAGQPRELGSKEKNNPHLKVHSRYFLPYEFANELFGKYPTYHRSWLLLWRDVARATDERSCISTVIPKVVASRKCPALGFSVTDNFVGLITNLNSFIFDYTARQKLGSISFSFYILKQLPVLPPATYAAACCWDSAYSLGDWILPRALELTYTAWDLAAFAKDCGYDGPPFRWDEERRFLLRCELDAAYFHLYGIARDDVDYIMDTFRVWREKEEKQCGEYRTKRVILEIYDEMRRAMETGVAYQTWLVPGPADPAVAHGER